MSPMPPLTPFEAGFTLRLYFAYTTGFYGLLHLDDVSLISIVMKNNNLTQEEAIVDILKLYDWRMSVEWGVP